MAAVGRLLADKEMGNGFLLPPGDKGDTGFALLLSTMGAACPLLRWEEDGFLGLPLPELTGKKRLESGYGRDGFSVVSSLSTSGRLGSSERYVASGCSRRQPYGDDDALLGR
ncbi:hypothetical protein ACLOJK_038205 [Asimina triloba]